ncbi:hypothetical protein ICW40_12855 [Actinotalea ferrariae]|uniref:hypothetical protein n=1 Tax=Actinotalea ferrariae TaxID=1386098 RepID=UPI001C8B4497|nr:hypothetical protein [Actinotalea ferrariae]MBX9245692.1 hypothetical protein [Actinotalea ferrariae]
MTDLTGGAVRPAGFSASVRPAAPEVGATAAPAGVAPLRTGAELRAALAALPTTAVRRGFRPEAVDRLVEKAAEELDRRARGEAPSLRSEHVHPDGFAMTRPGYAVAPTRALLAAAAQALRVDRTPRRFVF